MNKINKSIKVIIADEYFLVRKACKNLVDSFFDKSVTAEARSYIEAFEIMNKGLYNLLILNVRLINGLEEIRVITNNFPFTKLLLILDIKQKLDYKKILKLGTIGLITKETSEQEIQFALNAVINGNKYICSELQNGAIDHMLNDKEAELLSSISKREFEVINLITSGLCSREIAEKLFISIKTVESHRRKIYKKLNVRNVVSLLDAVNNSSFIKRTASL